MRFQLVLSILLLLSACSPRLVPAPDPTQVPPASEAPLPARTPDLQTTRLTALAVADLSTRLSLDPGLVRVLSAESMLWPDSSLGCPRPGETSVQGTVPGYQIILEANDELYSYHTDADRTVILCTDEELPSFPVTPGEIDDGEPWMPVD